MSDTATREKHTARDAAQPPAGTPAAPEAAEVTCDYPVPQGTEKNGQKVTKPCIKPKGHEGNHSARKFTKIDTSVLEDNDLEADIVPGNVVLTGLTESGPRSEKQVKVDEQVKAAHEAWIKAGKPTNFNEAIKKGAARRHFVADASHAPAVRKLLDSAANLHGIHVRKLPVKKHTDGRSMVYWMAVDKRTKKETDKKDS